MSKTKKITIIAAVIVILLLVGIFAGSLYFYRIAIARTSKEFLQSDEELQTTSVMTDEDKKYQWYSDMNFETVEIKSSEGLALKGRYLLNEQPSDKTVILAHGYSSEGKEMISFARMFYERFGYNILIPDNRAHGQSEGQHIGFGWLDRMDYLKWIDYAIETCGDDVQIVLFGVSMGGATVLMTSGEQMPDNVKAVISDCAYSSVKAELGYQLNRMYHMPKFPFLNVTSLLTKINAGYYFGEASAVKQVAKSVTPTLFIHGDADKFVPFEMVNELYEACSSEKELYTVPGAMHGTSYRDDPEKYTEVVSSFLGKYIIEAAE